MRYGGWGLERELELVLEKGRIFGPVPDVVRARALARARAAVAATATSTPAVFVTPARARRRGVALAAALALLVGAAGAVAAMRNGAMNRLRPLRAPDAPAIPAPPSAPEGLRLKPAAIRPVEPATRSRERRHAPRPPNAQESYAAELGLLRLAQVAYASRDFSSTLVLVAEHARRFPHGRLAEEREALRVRSLAGSGRIEEARGLTSAFGARFPQSVLLPRLMETVGL